MDRKGIMMDGTAYLIDMTAELNEKMNKWIDLIGKIYDKQSYAEAASQYYVVHGILTGAWWVVNNADDDHVMETIQDVLIRFEERVEAEVKIMKSMKLTYWKE